MELSGVNKAIKSPQSAHHSNWVVTPCCCQAELLDVRVLLHGFGQLLQRGNWNVLKNQQKTHCHWYRDIHSTHYTLHTHTCVSVYLNVVEVDLC